ncbi:MAG TPA: hypothetical protein VEX15_23080 [Nocardioidaceae bacterium]|nr:hypothetical protein [Nocardioidaceae bacterium]
MIKKLTLSVGVVAAAMAAAFVGPSAQAVDADHSHNAAITAAPEPEAITAADLKAMAKHQGDAAAPIPGWDVPWAMSFYLESSCSPYAGAIRQGAAAWNQLSEGGGSPVECRTDYITDCGGGGNIVGCNWGAGQRIALFPGGVNDDALLAAHEFGHDWYGHSSFQCAGWGSPAEVMSPTICNLALNGGSQGRM